METWERNPANGNLKKILLRRNLRVGILEEAPWKTHGGTSREPWGEIQGPSGAPEDLPVATKTTFWAEEKCAGTMMFFSEESGAIELLACTGARQHACTKYRACAQKLTVVNVQIAGTPNGQSQSHRQNPYSVNTVWGNSQARHVDQRQKIASVRQKHVRNIRRYANLMRSLIPTKSWLSLGCIQNTYNT